MHSRIQLWLAETLLLRDHLIEAEPHLNAALQTARAHGRTLLLIQGERLQARLLATRNEWRRANALFTKTLASASSLNLSLEVARTQAAWGESLLRYAKSPHNGDSLLTEARKTFAAHGARAALESTSLPVNVS